jgi:hypothetical protein
MTHRLCMILVVLTICAMLSVAIQPAVAQTSTAGSATSSNTNEWTPSNVIALMAAVGALITSIIAAIRGTGAQSKTDAHEQRLNTFSDRQNAHSQEVSQRLSEHSTRINEIATNMVPPALLPQMARQTGTGDGGGTLPPR